MSSRSYLKKAFWPDLGVGLSFQVPDILEYACGLKLETALILNPDPFIEIASNTLIRSTDIPFTTEAELTARRPSETYENDCMY